MKNLNFLPISVLRNCINLQFIIQVSAIFVTVLFFSGFTSCSDYYAIYTVHDNSYPDRDPDKVMRGKMKVINGVEVQNPVEVFEANYVGSVDFLNDGRYIIAFNDDSGGNISFFTRQNMEYQQYSNSDLKSFLNTLDFNYPRELNAYLDGAYWRSLDTIVINIRPEPIPVNVDHPMRKISLLVNPLNDVVYDYKDYSTEYPYNSEPYDENTHAFLPRDFYPYEDVKYDGSTNKIYFKNQEVEGLPAMYGEEHFDYFKLDK